MLYPRSLDDVVKEIRLPCAGIFSLQVNSDAIPMYLDDTHSLISTNLRKGLFY